MGYTYKKIAKKNNDKSLFGNKLDRCIREMNYGQTNGILVGNAISRIISEIILCMVDKEIQVKFKNINCCRFIDDYYIFLKDSSQIQNIISFIRNELGKYELTLNENKIKINESPFVYGKIWVEEIKLFIHLNSEIFLNKAITLYMEYKDINILRYSLTVLSLHDFNKKQWGVMESKILNLWVKFPSLSDLVIKIVLNNIELINKSNLKSAIYSIFNRCILLNQHQEIIWAVWFAKTFNVKIKNEYIIKIIESKNSLAIIILLDIIHSKNYSKSKTLISILLNLKKALYMDDLDENEESDIKKRGNLLWSQNWLLAYEADLNKWLDINGDQFEYARNDEFFKNLIKYKISFYDVNFQYSNVSRQEESIQYVTRGEFLSFVERINELLNQITESTEITEDDIAEIKTIKKDIMDIIEEKADIY
jgi:hypothetical protein